MGYEDKIRHGPPEVSGYMDKIGAPPLPPPPAKDAVPSGLPWEGYYYSAYGIAAKHGFNGTEAEWLESLKGHDGNNLIELNEGIEVKLWVGSIEEYNALPRLEESVLYFIEEPIR